MEIERKFITSGYPYPIDRYKKLEITQGYIVTEPEIRIRKENDRYYYTYKDNGTISREETEYEIDELAYSFYISNAKNVVHKTRYLIPLDNYLVAEYDIYHEELEGLKIVEVEFSDLDDAQAFFPPMWFGREVTYDYSFKNKNLNQSIKQRTRTMNE